MLATLIREYFVHDDFNYEYSFRIRTNGLTYYLCSVHNSEDGPIGENESIEALTRDLIAKVKPTKWRQTAYRTGIAEGSFTSEAEIEVSSDEIERITALKQVKR